MSDKLILNLNEENKLDFKISIEGHSSDIDSTTPKFRFVLSEVDKQNIGWLFEGKKGNDGLVSVVLPSHPLFEPEKSYKGQLEVILGNHFFVPTSVDIEFIKPLKVEAVVVSSNKANINDKQLVEVSSVTVTQANKVETKPLQEAPEAEPEKSLEKPPEKTKKPKKNWNELTKEQQEKIKKLLREKRLEDLKKQKELAEQHKPKQPKSKETSKEKLKNHFKDLLAKSLD